MAEPMARPSTSAISTRKASDLRMVNVRLPQLTLF
jgi:hypothetical protein